MAGRGAGGGRDPVVVVGGGLAGMAAAARIAKAGYSVELFEAASQLGGAWAPYDVAGPTGPVRVDSAPSVLGFPAPFRDLFRKSGRAFDVELQRQGYALVPAPPARHIFADGCQLELATDRGEQYHLLHDTYGTELAARWRLLLDGLDDVWQTVRPLGLEGELVSRSQLRGETRRRLRHWRTVEHLARDVGHPHLAALIRSTAVRLGSRPERTPAWCAVELSIARRFGRWRIDGPEVGRTSVLVEALTQRLAQRRVQVHLDTRVHRILIADDRACGVLVGNEEQPAGAVVATVDPWQLYDTLLPADAAGSELRGVRRLRPAAAPGVSHSFSGNAADDVTETVLHPDPADPYGGLQVTYHRPADGATLISRHDFGSPHPSSDAAWDGFRSWLRRPPTRSRVAGLFVAGPFSRGGGQPSQTVLSGALASQAGQDYLASLAR
jgi:phytoene dehydrogenase-like protein